MRKPCAMVPPKGELLRALAVDVDPLEVVDRLGEGVDALLRDLDPGRDARLPRRRDAPGARMPDALISAVLRRMLATSSCAPAGASGVRLVELGGQPARAPACFSLVGCEETASSASRQRACSTPTGVGARGSAAAGARARRRVGNALDRGAAAALVPGRRRVRELDRARLRVDPAVEIRVSG